MKTIYSVIYGNYYPREVDSYWNTKEEAEAQCERLADEQEAEGLGRGMWEVEEVTVSSRQEIEDDITPENK